jgi:biopolymer transport protein ExbB
MMIRLIFSLIGLLALINPSIPVHAEDMRAVIKEAINSRNELLEKARLEAETARNEASERTKQILGDKNALVSAIEKLEEQNAGLRKETEQLQKESQTLAACEKEVASALEDSTATIQELGGFVKTSVKDLHDLLIQSQQTALDPDRGAVLNSILKEPEFPGMDDICKMAELLLNEIKRSGEVRIEHQVFVNRAGEEIAGRILLLGNFTAAYQLPGETGFLIYSDKSQRLFALSKLPPYRLAKQLDRYMAGMSEDVPIDISRGAALRQLSHQMSLLEYVWKGGPIIWPILGIGVAGLLIIIERFTFLYRMNINADWLMGKIKSLISQNKWTECTELCSRYNHKPVSKVLLAGIESKDMTREDMENVLQETILREIPRLERFLSTLGILATIAPLLGLLGTVTGMINTFHVITYYGTGDPKMMSGGISEALVTTMLGLAVAIPIMLCHTILNRKVENAIGQMEEKGVALTNEIFKLEDAP